MRIFVAISSTVRGVILPAELLEMDGQWAANAQMACDELEEGELASRRQRFGYQLERDPLPSADETAHLGPFGRRRMLREGRRR